MISTVENTFPNIGASELSEGPRGTIDRSASGVPILPERSARVITRKPQLPITDHELRARIQWERRTSPHFDVSYDRTAFAVPAVQHLIESMEAAYSRIFHFTHESFPDRLQVYAMDQRASSLLGRSIQSHFNSEERAVYLAETGSQPIYAELVELLTHAMRTVRYARHYDRTPGWAVLEEAFSIFLSERLATHDTTFPFYGAEADVIAHYLYKEHANADGSSFLLRVWETAAHTLTTDQIVLAGAFMLYLGDTFSDDRVIHFSKSNDPIGNETFRTFFGSSLVDLEAAWLQHLPISLLTLTESEQEASIQHWDRAIECKRYRTL